MSFNGSVTFRIPAPQVEVGLRFEMSELEGGLITHEIREASSPTMRGHFGCIFKDTEEYTTGVWWAFYMRIMGT